MQIHALKSTTIQLDIECQDKSNRGAMVLDYLLKSQIGDFYSYHPYITEIQVVPKPLINFRYQKAEPLLTLPFDILISCFHSPEEHKTPFVFHFLFAEA